MNWVLLWLFLHITAAVLAFGPIFAIAIIEGLARREPQNLGFALRAGERISKSLVAPLSASMLISGTGLLISAHIDLLRTPYLIVAIALYLIATGLAVGRLVPNQAKLIRMLESMPGPTAGAPPADLQRLLREQRIGGVVTQALFLAIITLMILKPGGIVGGPLFG